MAVPSARVMPRSTAVCATFTYCWAIVEPPWTALCCRSFTVARIVPLGSIAPCAQYLSSSIATIAWTMFWSIRLYGTGCR